MARQELGFSLIELLIVSSLLLLLMLGVSTLFLASLTTDARISLRQELRAEGTYALDTLSYFIRNSKALTGCTTNGTSLIITGGDGGVSTFRLSGDQIASVSAARTTLLTVNPYAVKSGTFVLDCNENNGRPYVTVSFTLERFDSQGKMIDNDFRHTALVRNKQ